MIYDESGMGAARLSYDITTAHKSRESMGFELEELERNHITSSTPYTEGGEGSGLAHTQRRCHVGTTQCKVVQTNNE